MKQTRWVIIDSHREVYNCISSYNVKFCSITSESEKRYLLLKVDEIKQQKFNSSIVCSSLRRVDTLT